MPDRIGTALHSMRNTVLGTGALMIILIAVLFIMVFTDRSNEADRRQRENTRLVESRVENCHHYNEDQERNRFFQVSNILTLSHLSTGKDIEDVKQDPRYQQYVEFINDSFPFRQCSVECVNALADPNIQDCAKASTEKGDP